MEDTLFLPARQRALELLNRCEQCRFLLARKLEERGYRKAEIDCALDDLEAEGLLSDRRYAFSWTRSRSISHHEGRSRLLSELLQRGIDRQVAQSALDEFFEETPESECCRRAVEKYRRTGAVRKAPLDVHLKRLGFPLCLIRDAAKLPS